MGNYFLKSSIQAPAISPTPITNVICQPQPPPFVANRCSPSDESDFIVCQDVQEPRSNPGATTALLWVTTQAVQISLMLFTPATHSIGFLWDLKGGVQRDGACTSLVQGDSDNSYYSLTYLSKPTIRRFAIPSVLILACSCPFCMSPSVYRRIHAITVLCHTFTSIFARVKPDSPMLTSRKSNPGIAAERVEMLTLRTGLGARTGPKLEWF